MIPKTKFAVASPEVPRETTTTLLPDSKMVSKVDKAFNQFSKPELAKLTFNPKTPVDEFATNLYDFFCKKGLGGVLEEGTEMLTYEDALEIQAMQAELAASEEDKLRKGEARLAWRKHADELRMDMKAIQEHIEMLHKSKSRAERAKAELLPRLRAASESLRQSSAAAANNPERSGASSSTSSAEPAQSTPTQTQASVVDRRLQRALDTPWALGPRRTLQEQLNREPVLDDDHTSTADNVEFAGDEGSSGSGGASDDQEYASKEAVWSRLSDELKELDAKIVDIDNQISRLEIRESSLSKKLLIEFTEQPTLDLDNDVFTASAGGVQAIRRREATPHTASHSSSSGAGVARASILRPSFSSGFTSTPATSGSSTLAKPVLRTPFGSKSGVGGSESTHAAQIMEHNVKMTQAVEKRIKEEARGKRVVFVRNYDPTSVTSCVFETTQQLSDRLLAWKITEYVFSNHRGILALVQMLDVLGVFKLVLAQNHHESLDRDQLILEEFLNFKMKAGQPVNDYVRELDKQFEKVKGTSMGASLARDVKLYKHKLLTGVKDHPTYADEVKALTREEANIERIVIRLNQVENAKKDEVAMSSQKTIAAI